MRYDNGMTLSRTDCIIAYAPLPDEPDYRTAPQFQGVPVHVLSQSATDDPFARAEEYKKLFAGKSVAILIPGTRFDAAGTRHGRGGGWFDRFLSAAPREWLRVGVLFDHQLSAETLVRKDHDEPMDRLLVVNSAGQWSLTRAQF